MEGTYSSTTSRQSVGSYCHCGTNPNPSSELHELDPVESNEWDLSNENELLHPYNECEDEGINFNENVKIAKLRILVFAQKQKPLSQDLETMVKENLHNDSNIMFWKKMFPSNCENQIYKTNPEVVKEFCSVACSVSPSSTQLFGLWNPRTKSWVKLWESLVLVESGVCENDSNVVDLSERIHLEFKIRFRLKVSKSIHVDGNIIFPEPSILSYQFHQTRHDFLQNAGIGLDGMDQTDFINSAMTLAVVDLIRLAFLLHVNPRELIKVINAVDLLPISIKAMSKWMLVDMLWRFFYQQRFVQLVKKTFPFKSGMQPFEAADLAEFSELSYLECMEREFPLPGTIFTCQDKEVCVSGDNGITIRRVDSNDGIEQETNPVVVLFHELADLTIIEQSTEWLVFLSDIHGRQEELHFTTQSEALEFTTCVEGFHQVLVGPNYYLCGSVATKHQLTTARLHCFGYISREHAVKILLESPKRSCLLRRCGQEFGCFYLSVRKDEQCYHFKIMRNETNKYGIWGRDETFRFNSIGELVSALEHGVLCKDIDTKTLMKNRVFPSVKDRQPLLSIKNSESTQEEKSMPSFILPEDIEIKTILYPSMYSQSYINLYKPLQQLVMVRMLGNLEHFGDQRKDLVKQSYKDSMLILSQVHDHSNITTWHGIANAGDVLDYSDLGSVTEHLFRRAKQQLVESCRTETSAAWLMEVVYQLSHALNYLEEKQLAHGKICGERLRLFDTKPWVKIGDAGVQVDLEEEGTTGQKILPILQAPWLAHEFCHLHSNSDVCRSTVAGDRWSFGTTVCELVLAAADLKIDGYNGNKMPRNMIQCYMQSTPMKIPGWLNQIGRGSLSTLINKCWNIDPSKRPSFRVILQIVARIVRNGECEGYVTELSDEADAQRFQHTTIMAPITEFPREFVFRDKDLKHQAKLGEGQYGTVSLYEYCPQDLSQLAVKKFKPRDGDIRYQVEIIRELQTMVTIKHKYVVELKGISLPSNGIVMEYLPRGSLESYLVDRKKRIALTLLEPDLLRFIMQIAIGMVALQKHRIIHRDLAARNILISARPNSFILDVKIADFGLSRSIPTSKDEYIDSSSLFLPTKWLAPECYSSNPRFTMQSDVWSFGVTGFEILDPTSKVVSMLPSDPSILTRKFESGWRLEKPGEMKKWMYSLLLRCWSMEPEDRITFPQIVELLGQNGICDD